MDLGCHTLDYLDFFLGPIVKVQGHAGNQGGDYPAEDTVSGSFVFESGIQGTGLWCFDCFERVDRTEIVGTEGKLVFSSFGTEAIQCVTAEGCREYLVDHPEHVQQPLIQTIVNELNGHGVCASNGVSAARTAWVMQEMLSS